MYYVVALLFVNSIDYFISEEFHSVTKYISNWQKDCWYAGMKLEVPKYQVKLFGIVFSPQCYIYIYIYIYIYHMYNIVGNIKYIYRLISDFDF